MRKRATKHEPPFNPFRAFENSIFEFVSDFDIRISDFSLPDSSLPNIRQSGRLFCTNKPNLPNTKMNLSQVMTKYYKNQQPRTPGQNKPNQTQFQKQKTPLPYVPGGDRSAASGVASRIGMTRGARRDDFEGARRDKGHSRRYQAGDPGNYTFVGSETIVSIYGCSSWCVAAVSCHSGLGSCEGCSCWLWPSGHDCDSCDWSDDCWDWLPGFTALIILSKRSQNIFNLLQEIAFCLVISAFKPFFVC
jgi:hypothetical protein